MPTFDCVIGADRKFALTLRDGNDDAVTTYTSGATLAASVWAGDDVAQALAPTATWINATAGTVQLALAAADTANLSPGLYQVLLTVTAGGIASSRPVLWLNMLSKAGSGTAPTTYCTYDHMRQIAGEHLASLQTSSDQAGFAEQRHRARMEFERLVQSRYRGGGNARYYDTMDHILDGQRPRRSGYEDPTLQTCLDADYLIRTGPTGEAVVRWCALMACAYVYERQVGSGGDGAGGYRTQAARWRGEAEAIASCLTVGVKASADETTPSYQVLLGAADTLKL